MGIPEDTIAPRTMAIDDFSDLKVQMDEFQSKVHQFLITKRQDLAARSENFWNSESGKLKKIEELKGKLRELSTHQSSLEEEFESSQRDASEANAQSKAFQTKREKLIGEREFLHKELEKLEILLKEQTDDLVKEKESRVSQSTKDAHEVSRFEAALGLHISASTQDVITFHFDSQSADTSSQLSISLDVSQEAYKIVDSNPELPQIVKKELVLNLTNTDDLRLFLQSSRSQLMALSQ